MALFVLFQRLGELTHLGDFRIFAFFSEIAFEHWLSFHLKDCFLVFSNLPCILFCNLIQMHDVWYYIFKILRHLSIRRCDVIFMWSRKKFWFFFNLSISSCKSWKSSFCPSKWYRYLSSCNFGSFAGNVKEFPGLAVLISSIIDNIIIAFENIKLLQNIDSGWTWQI